MAVVFLGVDLQIASYYRNFANMKLCYTTFSFVYEKIGCGYECIGENDEIMCGVPTYNHI